MSCLHPGHSIILRGRKHEFNSPFEGEQVDLCMQLTEQALWLFDNGNSLPRGVVEIPILQCLRDIQILHLIMCFNFLPTSWT